MELYDCNAPLRLYPDQSCSALDPPCGDPGACCDDYTGVCADGVLQANCSYRHAGGVSCADLTPGCGELCVHTVLLTDCTGYGWHGGWLDVYVDGTLVLEHLTLADGHYWAWHHFWAATGSVIHTVYHQLCWDWGCYEIFDGAGLLIAEEGWGFVPPTGVTVAGNCEPLLGACCDEMTGVCDNDVEYVDCDGTFYLYELCEALSPPCGDPGACCDDDSASCVDGVVVALCTTRHAGGVLCEDLDPPCGEWSCYDATFAAPGSWTGNTCGAVNDCTLRSSEDLNVRVIIPTPGNWQFDLCGGTTVWDTYLYVGNDCCVGTWYDDDGCGTVLSKKQIAGLAAGTYYATLEAYSSACGPVTLQVVSYEPADRAAESGAPITQAPEQLPPEAVEY